MLSLFRVATIKFQKNSKTNCVAKIVSVHLYLRKAKPHMGTQIHRDNSYLKTNTDWTSLTHSYYGEKLVPNSSSSLKHLWNSFSTDVIFLMFSLHFHNASVFLVWTLLVVYWIEGTRQWFLDISCLGSPGIYLLSLCHSWWIQETTCQQAVAVTESMDLANFTWYKKKAILWCKEILRTVEYSLMLPATIIQ